MRRKWDSLKGYFLRQAQKNADKPNGSAAEVVEDASDAVHWAYYDRLKFLSSSLKIDDEDERDEENATPQQQHRSSDISNGSVKHFAALGKKRKVDNTHDASGADHHNEIDHSLQPPPPPLLPPLVHPPPPTEADTSSRDPDEYGIGKYVGKTIQGLDEDLVDELVSQIVRDCLEVRHKQRLRHIEYYNRHNSSLTN